MAKIRLNKYLSSCGVSSRRAAERLMEEGKVKVNGIIIREMGFSIDPQNDKVIVGEIQVQPKEERVYYMLNKPAGYVCTSFDPFGRKKALDLVSKTPRVFNVGRLDFDTTGLLILTNDGDLTNRLTHPKFEKEKEYLVKSQIANHKSQANPKSQIQMFKDGIKLQEGIAKADEIKVVSQKDDILTFQIVIHQGWKRQIRRMCEEVGLKVLELKRMRVGRLELGDLKEGEWKKLTEREVEKLLK